MEKWIEYCEYNGTVVLRSLSHMGYFAKQLHKGEQYFSFGIKDTLLKYGTPLKDKSGCNIYDDFIRFLEDETSAVFRVNAIFILL